MRDKDAERTIKLAMFLFAALVGTAALTLGVFIGRSL